MKDLIFEVCANGVESCVAAQEGGADRVELCAGIPEGGTTPSYGEIKTARRLLTTTRLHVIIRPRGGDFLYTPLEEERMIEDIKTAGELGADGIVIGCLTREGDIDVDMCKRLLEHAGDMSATFHRAFDHCRDTHKGLEDLISLGFDRVLTSGQQPTAESGIAMLSELDKQARGRIKILAGCGVNEHNIRKIYEGTGIEEYHFSARIAQKSLMRHINNDVFMGNEDVDETTIMVTSAKRVADTIKACLNNG